MTHLTLFPSLLGGIFIGLAASSLLLTTGRIAGISGIAGGLLSAARGDFAWRLFFLLGLLCGGFLVRWLVPEAVRFEVSTPLPALIAAGLLVGYGTRLGSGCTSGHGVCGIARLSPRSLVATLCFMTAGFATVFVVRHLLGGG